MIIIVDKLRNYGLNNLIFLCLKFNRLPVLFLNILGKTESLYTF